MGYTRNGHVRGSVRHLSGHCREAVIGTVAKVVVVTEVRQVDAEDGSGGGHSHEGLTVSHGHRSVITGGDPVDVHFPPKLPAVGTTVRVRLQSPIGKENDEVIRHGLFKCELTLTDIPKDQDVRVHNLGGIVRERHQVRSIHIGVPVGVVCDDVVTLGCGMVGPAPVHGANRVWKFQGSGCERAACGIVLDNQHLVLTTHVECVLDCRRSVKRFAVRFGTASVVETENDSSILVVQNLEGVGKGIRSVDAVEAVGGRERVQDMVGINWDSDPVVAPRNRSVVHKRILGIITKRPLLKDIDCGVDAIVEAPVAV